MSDDYSYDDEETTEEEQPQAAAPRRVVRREAIAAGWGTAEATKSKNSAFAERLEVKKDMEYTVKFLEDFPYTSYHFHWIEKQGQKSYTCIDRLDERGCPLCKAGSKPQARFCFNVVLLSKYDDPVVRSYEGGVRAMESLKAINDSASKGPLTKHYWNISKTGTGTSTMPVFDKLRLEEVEEMGITPLTDEALAALAEDKYDSTIVPVPKYETLQEVATEDLGAE